MTDDTTDERTGTDRSTLADMDHTNPTTGEAFGATQTYDRGRTIAADGGVHGAADAAADGTVDGARAKPKPTLGDMEHTNPYTGQTFGTTQTYDRGRTVAADGGEPGAVDDEAGTGVDDEDDVDVEGTAERDIADEEMRDVDHTAPGDSEGTNQVYERGKEPRDEGEVE